MVIQHNMSAANTNRQLGITAGNLSKGAEKLASGYRINRAGDDAAGLSISEKMRGQIRGLERASTNAQDGISLIQTAEGALQETHSILQRMRELAVQASNDTNVTADRQAIAKEMNALTSEIDRIASTTEFNTMKLLSGGFQNKVLQLGANTSQVISFHISAMSAAALGLVKKTGTFSYSNNQVTGDPAQVNSIPGNGKTVAAVISGANTGYAATQMISVINSAITKVSTQRSYLGALQNRLEHSIANADNTAENLQSAESRIRDVDMAKQMVSYSKDNILQQAATSMLAQANQSNQGVLSLLQ